jgi:hypothetical protein
VIGRGGLGDHLDLAVDDQAVRRLRYRRRGHPRRREIASAAERAAAKQFFLVMAVLILPCDGWVSEATDSAYRMMSAVSS